MSMTVMGTPPTALHPRIMDAEMSGFQNSVDRVSN
jgi:hypothetical protein